MGRAVTSPLLQNIPFRMHILDWTQMEIHVRGNGCHCKGEKEMVAAPWKTDESGEYIQPMQEYDSVVNDVNNPAMYVALDDSATYRIRISHKLTVS